MLDEPAVGVDIKSRDDVRRLLAGLNADGVAVLLTAHEPDAVAAQLPYVPCIIGGVVTQGDPCEVFTAEVLAMPDGAVMPVLQQDGLLRIADVVPHHPRERPRHPPHAHDGLNAHIHEHDYDVTPANSSVSRPDQG